MNTEERLDEHGKRLWDLEQKSVEIDISTKGALNQLFEKFDELKEMIKDFNDSRKKKCEETTGKILSLIEEVETKINNHINDHAQTNKKFIVAAIKTVVTSGVTLLITLALTGKIKI